MINLKILWMSEIVFKRDIYNELLEWKKSNGSYAVMIEGARRIGKRHWLKHLQRMSIKAMSISISLIPQRI